MNVRSVFLLLILSCRLSISGAYVADRTIFEETFPDRESLAAWSVNGKKPEWIEHGGPDGKGNAVRMQVTGTIGNSFILRKFKAAEFSGLIVFEAMVRGENLDSDGKAYHGPKFMLICGTGKRPAYPEPFRELGSYGWKHIRCFYRLPADNEKIEFLTGIQAGAGTFYVANIRISSARIEKSGQTEIPVNAAAAKIPRGKFTGTRYRGVMSGGDLSPEAFATLGAWGANLMRFQFNPAKGEKIDTREEYLAWIKRKIKELDAILPLVKQYRMKIAIDLHTGPGTTMSRVASNVLGVSTDLETLEEAWRRIAAHYRGNPLIYGYDILNEPVPERYVSDRVNPWEAMAGRVVKVIRETDPDTPVIVAWHQCKPFLIDDRNVIYSPHFYSPHSYTHQGVLSDLKLDYPGEIDGVYWNKDQIRVVLKDFIEFQQRHNVRVFVGEFGCIAWVPSGREQYIRDCIEIFEEYGWDWTYHAFREWTPWSAEHVFRDGKLSKEPNPTEQVLTEAMRKNLSQGEIEK
ncbi:MAG TPA: glycoside hydrolase family 5 protein [Victivallis vadensis]|nr:glycoside hydrolase family 5 protein [Victivallis vadensis]